MNNKGFISYEALIMFVIVSFTIISSLNINHHNNINVFKIKMNIEKIEKKRVPDVKECDYKCLIEKALLVLK